ncbi:hypothetical protein FACS1894168_1720 [Deltaproteobacteria bacterium]|nr:hypothetical protein FACS1894168_1720 [Deltaproteobacteria bacterium]
MSYADLTKIMHGAVFSTIGEPVIVNGKTVTGIFRAEHEAVDVETGVAVSSVQPLLEVRESDLPETVDDGDPVIIRGLAYVVADARPDGFGVLKLFLHKIGGQDA